MADPLRATFVSQGAKVHFIAVGTPQQRDGHVADLTYVNAAIDALVPHLSAGDVVAGKSTVPVGIAAELAPRARTQGREPGVVPCMAW